jgi:ABC-type glutathione transport system ATPase component
MMNLLKTINTWHEIAKEFQGLKRRVMEVSERRTRYTMDDAIPKPNNTAIDLRLLAMYAQSAGLVGIDGPRDELIQLMDREDVPAYQLKVVSIVGFGGLGKTTLANQVYHKLEGEFQCTTFVSVSQKPNISKILRTILYHVGFNNASIQTWEDYELTSALQKFLSDKRYTNLIISVHRFLN